MNRVAFQVFRVVWMWGSLIVAGCGVGAYGATNESRQAVVAMLAGAFILMTLLAPFLETHEGILIDYHI